MLLWLALCWWSIFWHGVSATYRNLSTRAQSLSTRAQSAICSTLVLTWKIRVALSTKIEQVLLQRFCKALYILLLQLWWEWSEMGVVSIFRRFCKTMYILWWEWSEMGVVSIFRRFSARPCTYSVTLLLQLWWEWSEMGVVCFPLLQHSWSQAGRLVDRHGHKNSSDPVRDIRSSCGTS